MKKILHISKYYYPYYGGIEDVAYTIVEELRPYYEQKVICFNHEKGKRSYVDGSDVVRVKTHGTIASQPISLSYRKELKKVIADFRPDYIHVHLPNPLICFYLLTLNLRGIKVISHWHADILGKSGFYTVCKSIEDKFLKRSDVIIATSQMYMECSQPLRPYLDKAKVLPNTINETKVQLHEGEQIEVEAIRQKYEGKKIVFFVGRHVPYKGIDYLLKAADKIDKDAIVLIAGVGAETAMLKAQSAHLSNVKFIGRVSNDELKYYLHAATVFAFPSIDRREAFGVALAEALYCGVPAVSFNIEGSGAIWVNQHGKTGYIVENMSVEAYADALNKLLRSDRLRAEMSEQAKLWTKATFMKDQIAPVMQDIYQ